MNFTEFKQKYLRKEVNEYPNSVTKNPTVSVCVQTYQHAGYIKACLDGILMQQTNFPFEILVGEDASTDGTRNICIEYANRYPEKIRLFLHHRDNIIKINGNVTGRFNFLHNLYNTKGLYIALCDGDDYWIDPLKLQKQADFLKNNNDCSLVFTGCEVHKSTGERKNYSYSIKNHISLNDYLAQNYFMPTASLMFRRNVIESPTEKWMEKSFAADFVLRHRALVCGNIGYVDMISCVYNKGTMGSWSKRKLTKKIIIKEFSDHIRGLYYISKYKEIKKEPYIVKIKRVAYYKNAIRIGGLRGMWFLLRNFKFTTLFYIGAYIKVQMNFFSGLVVSTIAKKR